MENLILIPARSGSTRVHNKNIKLLCGKPLIGYTIENALKSSSGRVVVSTDSREIAEIARKFGADIPFMRPQELATSNSSSLSAIYHALDWFRDKEKWIPGLVAFCPPTNPFRRSQTISDMVNKISESPTANSIVTITAPKTHPFRIMREGPDHKMKNGVIKIDGKSINDIERSQDWPVVWEGSPACRITRSKFFDANRNRPGQKTYDVDNFIGFEISNIEALDIDSADDFILAEFYCKNLLRL